MPLPPSPILPLVATAAVVSSPLPFFLSQSSRLVNSERPPATPPTTIAPNAASPLSLSPAKTPTSQPLLSPSPFRSTSKLPRSRRLQICDTVRHHPFYVRNPSPSSLLRTAALQIQRRRAYPSLLSEPSPPSSLCPTHNRPTPPTVLCFSKSTLLFSLSDPTLSLSLSISLSLSLLFSAEKPPSSTDLHLSLFPSDPRPVIVHLPPSRTANDVQPLSAPPPHDGSRPIATLTSFTHILFSDFPCSTL